MDGECTWGNPQEVGEVRPQTLSKMGLQLQSDLSLIPQRVLEHKQLHKIAPGWVRGLSFCT